MTPQQAINQLKRDGFSDEEIIEAVLPMVREKFWVVEKDQKERGQKDGDIVIPPGHTFRLLPSDKGFGVYMENGRINDPRLKSLIVPKEACRILSGVVSKRKE